MSYTVDELAALAEAPHPYAYLTAAAYVAGVHLWESIHRDGELNPDERAARFLARLEMSTLPKSIKERYRRHLVERQRWEQRRLEHDAPGSVGMR